MGFFAPILALGKTLFAKKAVQQVATGLAVSAFQSSQQRKANAAAQATAVQNLQEQRVYDRDTLVRIREDAEKAGFNPLTALRNGASNIGSNTYMNAPALSSTDFIGQALMGAIDTGFNAPQRELDAETQRLQNDLYRAQIGELQANTDYLTRSHGFGIPAVESYGVSSNGSTNRSDSVDIKSRDDVVAVSVNGNTIRPALGWSNAQEFEDRYGDVASAAYGFGVLAADVINSRVPDLSNLKPTQLPANVNTVDWISGGWKN